MQLSGADRDEEALGVKLLADIRDVFENAGVARLSSAGLAASLCENEESPWGELDWGKQLDARGLAGRLKPFAVKPRTVRFDDGTTAKGYHLEQFEEAFSRYLAGSNRHNVTTRMDTGFAGDSQPSHVADKNRRKPAPANGCDVVTDKSGRKASRRVLRPGDPGYPLWISAKHTAGHITEQELDELLRWHRRTWAQQTVAAT